MHCGAGRTKAQNAPHWTTWKSASVQGYDWTSLWCNGDCWPFWLKRQRQRQRQRFWVHCLVRAIPSVLPLSAATFSTFFLMSEWCEVTRRQRRYAKKSQGWRAQSGLRAPKWQCAACKTRSFHSRTHAGAATSRDETQDKYVTPAEASAMPEECVRILESMVQQQEIAMKQARPLGQKTDQA